MTPIDAAAIAWRSAIYGGGDDAFYAENGRSQDYYRNVAQVAVIAFLKAAAEDEATIERVFSAWKDHKTLGKCARAAILSLVPDAKK